MDTDARQVSFRQLKDRRLPSPSSAPTALMHSCVAKAGATCPDEAARESSNRAGGLSRQEEAALFCRWKQRDDDRALQSLALAYEPLISRMIGGLARTGVSMDDVRQEARCGLLEAAYRFDPDKGFRFGTYARWWILAAITTYVAANRHILGRRTKQRSKIFASHFISLDAPMRPGGECAAELVPSEEAGPDLAVEQIIDGERMRSRLTSALNALNPREQLIVRRRHFSEKTDTLQTIADEMQVTPERVRQIERAALARLRKTLQAPETTRLGYHSCAGQRRFHRPSDAISSC